MTTWHVGEGEEVGEGTGEDNCVGAGGRRYQKEAGGTSRRQEAGGRRLEAQQMRAMRQGHCEASMDDAPYGARVPLRQHVDILVYACGVAAHGGLPSAGPRGWSRQPGVRERVVATHTKACRANLGALGRRHLLGARHELRLPRRWPRSQSLGLKGCRGTP